MGKTKRVHKRRYKCEISFGNASFIVPGSEMDVNVAKDNLSPSPLAASLTSQLHFRRRCWGKDQSGLDGGGGFLIPSSSADSIQFFIIADLVSVLWHLANPVTKKRIEEERRAVRTPLKSFFFSFDLHYSRGRRPRLPLRLLYTT